jgi:SnoaL-like domain
MKNGTFAMLLGKITCGLVARDRSARTAPAVKGQTDSLAELAARVTEAREEIRELFNRYGFAADTGDAKGWSEVWADNGRFEMQGVTIEGRANFFRSIDDPEGVHKQKIESRGSLHTTGGVTIGINGDEAWAEGSALVWVKGEGGYRPFTLSYNHWDLKKTNGRWEIVRRVARPVAPDNALIVYKSWQAA